VDGYCELIDVGTRLVTRAKYCISDLSRQGREPLRPIPRVGVAATIRVKGRGFVMMEAVVCSFLVDWSGCLEVRERAWVQRI
jgi:hypothetical protein